MNLKLFLTAPVLLLAACDEDTSQPEPEVKVVHTSPDEDQALLDEFKATYIKCTKLQERLRKRGVSIYVHSAQSQFGMHYECTSDPEFQAIKLMAPAP